MLAANLAVAIVRFVAAGCTGNSAISGEGIHAVVDTTSERLGLLGLRRSQQPLGYGREEPATNPVRLNFSGEGGLTQL